MVGVPDLQEHQLVRGPTFSKDQVPCLENRLCFGMFVFLRNDNRVKIYKTRAIWGNPGDGMGSPWVGHLPPAPPCACKSRLSQAPARQHPAPSASQHLPPPTRLSRPAILNSLPQIQFARGRLIIVPALPLDFCVPCLSDLGICWSRW